VDLEVLDDDNAAELFSRIIGAERAEAEPEAVQEVLAICAGLPLAIRIAGARLAARPGWSVRTLADRLSDQRRRMDEFTTGDLAVRACFQVSFDALPRRGSGTGVNPAHAFRILGTWQAPSIGLHSAVALLGEPLEAVTEALEILVDAHLLESPAPDQYRFHDLLRTYAAERAEAEELPDVVEDALRRNLGWYLQTADVAARVVTPYGDRVLLETPDSGPAPLAFATAHQALNWCEQERANLVAAVRQAASQGWHDVAWKLAVTVMACFDRLGYHSEWVTTHRIALGSARQIGDRQGEAWVLNNLGMVLSEQRAEDAVGCFEEAMAILSAIGDEQGQAKAANNLAYSYQLHGKYEDAVKALVGVINLKRQVGHRYGEVVALNNLGEAYRGLGHPDQAIASLGEALVIAREIGATRNEGYALYYLGRAHMDLGRIIEGTDLLEQAAAKHRAVDDRYGEAQDLVHVGTAYAQDGRSTQARERWGRAYTLFRGLENEAAAAQVRTLLAQLDQ
jgi:tetratricopeptide (TPR) repeat protein